jgi:ACT domain-containing protein
VSSYFAEMSDGLNNEVRLLIHQEGKRFEIPLELNAQNTTVAKSIKKDQLFYGVNTITLMVNGQPVAERLIFNRSKGLDSEEDISVTSSVKTGDSISLNLSMPEFDQKSTLSISVLPEQTISYVKNQNISSAFLLNPFYLIQVQQELHHYKPLY